MRNHNKVYAKVKATAIIVLLLLVSDLCSGQSLIDFQYKRYGLENDTFNVINNASHLDEFYENLSKLLATSDRKINIVHIGDSHIQGDYLTQPVRRNFQQFFGNAGRGLIVPGRVAGTNESYNIITRSNVSWLSKRCVFPDQPLPIGVGGITIRTDNKEATLDIFMNDMWLDYAFNTITLFLQADRESFDLEILDTTASTLAAIDVSKSDTLKNSIRVKWPGTTGAIKIKINRSDSSQNHATLFGMSFENGRNGILYHSIGVNGAKYRHYNAAEPFTEQVALLKPDLVVISLGTNESLDYPNLDKNLKEHIARLVGELQQQNPLAKFILTTPPPGFRQKTAHNPGLEIVRSQIIGYAVESGIGFWDMYKILGATEGAAALLRSGLLRTDGVHFTKDGYEYQGNLFYHALMKGYNQYVLQR